MAGDFNYDDILAPSREALWSAIRRELLSLPDSDRRRHYIFRDEFAAHLTKESAKDFAPFFEVGRSRGVRGTIAFQTPSQMIDRCGEPLTNALLSVCQHKVILGVPDYQGALFLSRILPQFHGFIWLRNYSTGGSTSYSAQGSSSSSSSSFGASEQRLEFALVPPDMIIHERRGDWRTGFLGHCISPALPATRCWRFHATPQWIKANIRSDIDTSCRLDEATGSLVTYPNVKINTHLRPLHRNEVKRFGLTFDPNGYVP
jgi:hypothetical protein